MLRLAGGQVEALFNELLPVEVRELPEDLAVLTGCWQTRSCRHQSSRPGRSAADGTARPTGGLHRPG